MEQMCSTFHAHAPCMPQIVDKISHCIEIIVNNFWLFTVWVSYMLNIEFCCKHFTKWWFYSCIINLQTPKPIQRQASTLKACCNRRNQPLKVLQISATSFSLALALTLSRYFNEYDSKAVPTHSTWIANNDVVVKATMPFNWINETAQCVCVQ